MQDITKGVERILENIQSQSYTLAEGQEEETSESTETDLPIEATLQKLSRFINYRIGYEDFTNTDKRNLVEIFVTHETTLTTMFNAIFQSKESPEISDKTKLISKQNSTELLGDFIKE